MHTAFSYCFVFLLNFHHLPIPSFTAVSPGSPTHSLSLFSLPFSLCLCHRKCSTSFTQACSTRSSLQLTKQANPHIQMLPLHHLPPPLPPPPPHRLRLLPRHRPPFHHWSTCKLTSRQPIRISNRRARVVVVVLRKHKQQRQSKQQQRYPLYPHHLHRHHQRLLHLPLLLTQLRVNSTSAYPLRPSLLCPLLPHPPPLPPPLFPLVK